MSHRPQKTLAILAVAAGAAWLIYKATRNYAWLETEGERFWRSLSHLSLAYVALSVSFIFFSYFCRSWRWRAFMPPIKTASVANIFVSTLIGFSGVALFGRPGEVVRPFLIARKENVTVASQFGAWTLERIFDGLTVGIMMGLALFLMPAGTSFGARSANVLAYLRKGGIALFLGAVAFTIFLTQLRNHQQIVMKLLLGCARPIPERYRSQARALISRTFESFAGGLSSVSSTTTLALCVAWSFAVWIPVLLAYWSVTRAFGPPMADLNMASIIVLMALTVTGSLVQIPGIGGGFQVVTVLALTQLFEIPLEIATTAAMLFWLVGFLMVLVPGVPLAAREGLSLNRLRLLINSNAVPSDRNTAPQIVVNPDADPLS